MLPKSDNPIRIAHLTSTHARNDTRIFRKMCVSLASQGYATYLIVADGKGNSTESGVTIVDVGSPRSRYTRAILSSLRVFMAALRQRANIYHIHDPELIPYAFVLKLMGKCVIYDIHEHYRDIFLDIYYLPYVLRWILSRMYGLAETLTAHIVDACIVPTEHMQKLLSLPRSIVIENYVKLSEFSVTDAQKEKAVCYIGILHHTRGVISMIDAAAIAGSTLYLAGHYYSDTLRQEATQRSSWSNVKELGFIDRVQMQDIFSRCIAGLVILAPRLNYNHSSCNKLFEYMSAGLPVIASDLPFARAVIEKHKCGLLVSPAMDVDAIAKAIEWLASHPEEAHEMGRRGRQAVEAEYAWEYEEIKLFNLYREVGGG